MKILHITHENGWRGGERQLSLLIEHQLKAGDTPMLAAPPDSMIIDHIKRSGAICLPLSMHSDLDLAAAVSLNRIIYKEAPVLLHAHTGRAHGITALLSLFARRPPLVVSRRVAFPLKSHWLNRKKYQNANTYIAVSEASAIPLRSLGIEEDSIHIIYDGVDLHALQEEGKRKVSLRRELSIADNAFAIGNVGFCEENKNQRALIDTSRRVIETLPNAVFVIVGDGPLLENLKTLAAEAGTAEHFRFPGFREDVGAFHALFDLFVMPSLNEGLCSSILEAWSLNTPVIAADSSGMRELMTGRNGGVLVDLLQPNALPEAIAALAKDETRRSELARNGRLAVEREFSAKVMAEKTRAVYESLIEQ